MEAYEYMNSLKPGDKATRVLAGKIILPVIVKSVSDTTVTVSADDDDWQRKVSEVAHMMGIPLDDIDPPTWDFNKQTAGEIDEDLGWDGINTGSYLKLPGDEKEEDK